MKVNSLKKDDIIFFQKFAKKVYDKIFQKGYRQGQAEIHELKCKNKKLKTKVRVLQKTLQRLKMLE